MKTFEEVARLESRAVVAAWSIAVQASAADREMQKIRDTAMKNVVAVISEKTGIPSKDIMGRSRRKPIAHARQLAMVACVKGGFPQDAVGRFFKRDSTTVCHAVKAVQARNSRAKDVE